jgi:hypothetical protein
MGDPDYLMSGVGVNNVGLPQYYGKGFTINPNSGQIFIRINFRSGEDYKPDGTLNILGPIKFYGADVGDIPAPEGLIYMVTEVESTFSKGLFSQSLVCVMAPESSLVINNKNTETQRVDKSNDTAESGRLSNYPPPRSTKKIGLTAGNPSGDRIPAMIRGKNNTAEAVPAAAALVNGTTNNTSVQQINPKNLLPIRNTAPKAAGVDTAKDDQNKYSQAQQQLPRTNDNIKQTQGGR